MSTDKGRGAESATGDVFTEAPKKGQERGGPWRNVPWSGHEGPTLSGNTSAQRSSSPGIVKKLAAKDSHKKKKEAGPQYVSAGSKGHAGKGCNVPAEEEVISGQNGDAGKGAILMRDRTAGVVPNVVIGTKKKRREEKD